MIVIEKEHHFTMIPQHDHADISAQIVAHWKNNFLLRSKLREEADWAIRQHDRAWIPLDQSPKWNEDKNRPYSFIDYPLKEKLAAYQRGIEEVAGQSLYAGMLCSMHYASFFPKDSKDPFILSFLDKEKERQRELYGWMEMDIPYDIYDLHFRRLQFCDDLSLYVCMQEPGTPKEREISWFKNGFRQSFDFAPEGMIAHWVDDSRVSVQPFPFERSFEIDIPFRNVSKDFINQAGLEEAFQKTEINTKTIAFVKAE
ncbi:DUF3891 family protein [Halobacillus litoralis]|uniref:DUF3891 family protein n=1 Tax=Halobacillus litoralis TaxID=45668 RepID=UPI001CFD8163|nr:DUF3891 family protein [Halobacillus litoralis]